MRSVSQLPAAARLYRIWYALPARYGRGEYHPGATTRVLLCSAPSVHDAMVGFRLRFACELLHVVIVR